MEQSLRLSSISREDFREWLQMPCTQELIKRLQYEEEALRTVLGSGGGIRDTDVLNAGARAIELNAKADAYWQFRGKVNYDNVVSDDRKEVVKDVAGKEVVEGDPTGEDVSSEVSWASPARQAIRRRQREKRDKDAGLDGSE